MPVEVDSLKYLFRNILSGTPRAQQASGSNLNVLKRSHIASDSKLNVLKRSRVTTPEPPEYGARTPLLPFRYHPLNDDESLFWVSLYMILDKLVKPTGNRSQQLDDRLDEQRRLARGFFYDNKTRRDNFCYPPHRNFDDFKAKLEACIHKDLLPVAESLASIRRALVDAYARAEADNDAYPDGDISILNVADYVVPFYRKILAHLEKPENCDIEVTPMTEAQAWG